MPKSEELLEFGLSNEEAAEIQKSFIATKRDEHHVSENDSELEKLITDFEFDGLQVSSINFSKEVIAHKLGGITAFWEADPIVIKNDNSVVAVDHSRDGYVLSKCAKDSESFLDALVFVASIYENSETRSHWSGKHSEAVEKCSNLAKEPASVSFWGSLCPYL